MLVDVVHPLEVLFQHLTDGQEVPVRPPLRHLEQHCLGAIEGGVGVVGLVIADGGDLARGLDEATQGRAALDDLRVVFDMDGGGHRPDQGGEVRGSPHLVEVLAALQFLTERDEVAWLPPLVQIEEGRVDPAQLLAVEVFRPEKGRDLHDRVPVDEQGSHHRLLSLQVVGYGLVEDGRVAVQGATPEAPP